jgi:hypothetical protein
MKDLGGYDLLPSQTETMRGTFDASRARLFDQYGELIKEMQNERKTPPASPAIQD